MMGFAAEHSLLEGVLSPRDAQPALLHTEPSLLTSASRLGVEKRYCRMAQAAEPTPGNESTKQSSTEKPVEQFYTYRGKSDRPFLSLTSLIPSSLIAQGL